MLERKNSPLVTVLCISYNQAQYIAQTINSLLMQKVDFEYEILIHDDASTDGTAEIIKEYVASNPGIVRAKFEVVNQYSLNGLRFLKDMYSEARGEYIAICDGDDFWTDPD